MKSARLPIRQCLQRQSQSSASIRQVASLCSRPACTTTNTRPPASAVSIPRRHSSSRPYTTTPVPATDLLFGQPVHETHPHILQPGELTPGITAQEYYDRRSALFHSLPTNSAAILVSASTQFRSGAVFHQFRQDSNFLYLTGFTEPESLAVLVKRGNGEELFHLYCRPKDPRKELWHGPWSGNTAAQDVWNADEAGDIEHAPELLGDALDGMKTIYTDAALTQNRSHTPFGNILRAAAPKIPSSSIKPLKPLVNTLRAIKSPAEVANMRRAGRESGRALTAAMSRTWKTEKELAAFLDFHYVMSGNLDGQAYIPVVAGGSRGLLIHYTQNNAVLKPDDTILVDAGGEYGTYVSDITRTWPNNGSFSSNPAFAELYTAVLNTQRAIVSKCRATSSLSLDNLHQETEKLLAEELRQIGFDIHAGNRNTMLGILFPHHVGHYVGLDVHDCPGYPRNVVLGEGHCITIEPGVYVPRDADRRFPERFRGMAIRIEDSVAVGDEHPIVLTAEAVKEIPDIEAIADGRRELEERNGGAGADMMTTAGAAGMAGLLWPGLLAGGVAANTDTTTESGVGEPVAYNQAEAEEVRQGREEEEEEDEEDEWGDDDDWRDSDGGDDSGSDFGDLF
ncbi:peptidase M24, structural domain-containing protein [Xylariaceae sp. FL0255]|nr:peptidase M24, structural domain-containing protein [Xylariaceae sp. FL0255]